MFFDLLVIIVTILMVYGMIYFLFHKNIDLDEDEEDEL